MPARAIATAPHVIEGEMEVGGQEHFYLEGQVAAAIPQEDGMHILSSTQHPTEIQHKVAHALHLPMAAVRVEMRRMGGGFGGKESQGNALAMACALAARATGRPCKMRYDRDDDMMITGKRHDLKIRYKVGFDATGKVLGIDFIHLIRCGWSQDLSLAVADRAMLHADNCYHLPDIRIESHRLKTNTQSATAYRGFGGPQGMVGIERVMDHIAHVVKRDPAGGAAGQLLSWGLPHRAGHRAEDRRGLLAASRAVRGADHALSHGGRGFHRRAMMARAGQAVGLCGPAGGDCRRGTGPARS